MKNKKAFSAANNARRSNFHLDFKLKRYFEEFWQIFPNLLTSVDNCAFHNKGTGAST